MANDDYRLVRPLANPAQGGEAMEAALRKLGFAGARPDGPAGAQGQIQVKYLRGLLAKFNARKK